MWGGCAGDGVAAVPLRFRRVVGGVVTAEVIANRRV